MRDSFPAVYSTLSPHALVDLVLNNYDLGYVDKCLLWNRGLSDIYIVESAQKSYILRISHHHWRSRQDIDFELKLLDFLHQRKLPVAYPIPTVDNTLFVTIPALEGDRYAALFVYAEGSVPIGDLSPTQSQILGQTLGKLHDTGLDFTYQAPGKALTLEYLLNRSVRAIAPFLQECDRDLDYLQGKAREIEAQLADLPQSRTKIYSQINLFDFDQCGYGWRAFDVAKFLQVSLSAGLGRRVRDAFFEGYQAVQSLSERELNCLQALTQTAHIWAWAINIEGAAVHCLSRLDRSYFKKRLEHLRCLDL